MEISIGGPLVNINLSESASRTCEIVLQNLIMGSKKKKP